MTPFSDEFTAWYRDRFHREPNRNDKPTYLLSDAYEGGRLKGRAGPNPSIGRGCYAQRKELETKAGRVTRLGEAVRDMLVEKDGK